MTDGVGVVSSIFLFFLDELVTSTSKSPFVFKLNELDVDCKLFSIADDEIDEVDDF